MKKLGNGAQFAIYDLGNNKVLRKRLSKKRIALRALHLRPHFILMPWKIKPTVEQSIKDREKALNWFSKNKINSSLIANLKIVDNQVIQDKVTPIHKIILKDYETDKKIIDSFCKLLIKCMQNGFLEREYNFTQNYGLDKNNKVVLIDIGEMRFEKKLAKKDIEEQRWRIFYKVRPFFRGKTKKYFIEKMEDLLTLENLNKYWKTNQNI